MGKAAGFFFGDIIGTSALSILGLAIPKNPMMKFTAGYGLAILGSLGIQIWSAVDAVKNAKSETVQVIPYNKEIKA